MAHSVKTVTAKHQTAIINSVIHTNCWANGCSIKDDILHILIFFMYIHTLEVLVLFNKKALVVTVKISEALFMWTRRDWTASSVQYRGVASTWTLTYLLILVGWWTGSWSASVVHIFAVVAVVGVLEAVNWFWVDDFCRKTVPSIDHSLTKEEFPWTRFYSYFYICFASCYATWFEPTRPQVNSFTGVRVKVKVRVRTCG